LERKACGTGPLPAVVRKNAGAAIFLSTVLIGLSAIAIVFSPAASAQSPRKDSNTRSAAAASDAQQIAPGKDLFHEHCASCHFTDTTAQKIGPGLKGLYVRLTFSDGKKVTDASLTKWIEAGGKDMPGFKETMKPEQIRELISYIKTF
jgi:mono/diheme cytochrome c family protein